MSDIEKRFSGGEKPVRLAITMGDPTGIGPEVILKALSSLGDRVSWEAAIFGKPQVFAAEDAHLREILPGYRSPFEGARKLAIIDVAPEVEWSERARGQGGWQAARLQEAALNHAMAAVKAGEFDAIVTAPWNKALFTQIEQEPRGHTEVLASYFGVPDDVVMMLGGDRLRVALVTTHIPLSEVAGAMSREKIEKTLVVVARELQRRFGIRSPRLAICGLNPHAGESGHMGREEIEIIEPAIKRLRERADLKSVELVGPLPADTLFAKFRGGQAPFDAVICHYHDQGLIPLKLMHFGESANITLGLPVVRTSVDHGTAYDIAGQGKADEGSMGYALNIAASMVRQGRRADGRFGPI